MKENMKRALKLIVLLALVCAYASTMIERSGAASSRLPNAEPPVPSHNQQASVTQNQEQKLWTMTAAEAARRSLGCVDCHSGIEDMHNGKINLGCIDCHGGDAGSRAQGLAKGSPPYEEAKRKAHVQPKLRDLWKTSANPQRANAQLNQESAEFMRFVNPGDLRVARLSCGTTECHGSEVHAVGKSMMATGAMLWGAALYNNGSFPLKNYRFGESYAADGTPQRLQTVPQPSPDETKKKGVLPYLDPLPRWEISQMGNILRTFERGGRKVPEVGLPIPEELPGKPTQNLLSPRGLGTLLRTDPVFLGLQKTRLLDPMLSHLGTNDHPGDYRSSGCTACHVVYANDRDPFNAGPYAKFGHTGLSFSADGTIPKDEPGHPIRHQLTRAIPSSQCVVCHMHPGTLVLNTYLGYTW